MFENVEGSVATETGKTPVSSTPLISDRQPSWLDSTATRLLAPVDGASLVLFRIGFGLIMVLWGIDYIASGRIRDLYIAPKFHFTYYLFDFVRPWPGDGMYGHFLALCVLAACISLGFLYRLTTLLFALGFTYFFLLERTNYQNHYYLLLLLSWLLTILPLNRTVSLDVLSELTRPSSTVSTWCLWVMRFTVALPYVFGGIAKFHSDWFAGEPLRTHLASRSWMPLIGPYLNSEVVVNTFVWGGLIFDLAIVPLLVLRSTRTLAYILCVLFHLMNATLFSIHVFPWFMMFATTIFFEPDWPRRLCGGRRLALSAPGVVTWQSLSLRVRLAGMLLATYCAFQIAWPLRHHLYPGDAIWTERGHYFSWRMMLRAKVSAVRFYLTDSHTGETKIASMRPYLAMEQVSKFSRDPEMILQLAHFLADEYRTRYGREVEVRALVLTSLNGRKPQLLIDPNIDLAKEPKGFHFRHWIMPQDEPLREVAWSLPMTEWERHVTLPTRPFLDRAKAAAPPSTNVESDTPGSSFGNRRLPRFTDSTSETS